MSSICGELSSSLHVEDAVMQSQEDYGGEWSLKVEEGPDE